MFTEINKSSTLEALSDLCSSLRTYTAGNLVIQNYYIKISAEFDKKLNETSFLHNLTSNEPVIIVFEYNLTDTKIFWRNSGTEMFTLEIEDDVGGILSLFCAEFIANEIKSGNSGKFIKVELL